VLSYFIHASIAMLAIANPVAVSPLFASITAGMTKGQKRKSAFFASFAVLLILSGAVLVGTSVLRIFGVGLDAFRFGGGLIIVLMGLDMLKGDISPVHDGSNRETDQEDQIIIPFAMPLVAGPGTIATAITLTTTNTLTKVDAILVTLGAVLVTVIALRICLSFASQIADRLGGRPLRILTRFMGLILVAVGAQFLLAGFTGFIGNSLPALTQSTQADSAQSNP
jgi:multiple antibiotic resistance protein